MGGLGQRGNLRLFSPTWMSNFFLGLGFHLRFASEAANCQNTVFSVKLKIWNTSLDLRPV